MILLHKPAATREKNTLCCFCFLTYIHAYIHMCIYVCLADILVYHTRAVSHIHQNEQEPGLLFLTHWKKNNCKNLYRLEVSLCPNTIITWVWVWAPWVHASPSHTHRDTYAEYTTHLHTHTHIHTHTRAFLWGTTQMLPMKLSNFLHIHIHIHIHIRICIHI